jgi:hypothetical protein
VAPVNKTEDVCLRWWRTGGAGLGAQLDCGSMGLVLAEVHPTPPLGFPWAQETGDRRAGLSKDRV